MTYHQWESDGNSVDFLNDPQKHEAGELDESEQVNSTGCDLEQVSNKWSVVPVSAVPIQANGVLCASRRGRAGTWPA